MGQGSSVTKIGLSKLYKKEDKSKIITDLIKFVKNCLEYDIKFDIGDEIPINEGKQNVILNEKLYNALKETIEESDKRDEEYDYKTNEQEVWKRISNEMCVKLIRKINDNKIEIEFPEEMLEKPRITKKLPDKTCEYFYYKKLNEEDLIELLDQSFSYPIYAGSKIKLESGLIDITEEFHTVLKEEVFKLEKKIFNSENEIIKEELERFENEDGIKIGAELVSAELDEIEKIIKRLPKVKVNTYASEDYKNLIPDHVDFEFFEIASELNTLLKDKENSEELRKALIEQGLIPAEIASYALKIKDNFNKMPETEDIDRSRIISLLQKITNKFYKEESKSKSPDYGMMIYDEIIDYYIKDIAKFDIILYESHEEKTPGLENILTKKAHEQKEIKEEVPEADFNNDLINIITDLKEVALAASTPNNELVDYVKESLKTDGEKKNGMMHLEDLINSIDDKIIVSASNYEIIGSEDYSKYYLNPELGKELEDLESFVDKLQRLNDLKTDLKSIPFNESETEKDYIKRLSEGLSKGNEEYKKFLEEDALDFLKALIPESNLKEDNPEIIENVIDGFYMNFSLLYNPDPNLNILKNDSKFLTALKNSLKLYYDNKKKELNEEIEKGTVHSKEQLNEITGGHFVLASLFEQEGDNFKFIGHNTLSKLVEIYTYFNRTHIKNDLSNLERNDGLSKITKDLGINLEEAKKDYADCELIAEDIIEALKIYKKEKNITAVKDYFIGKKYETESIEEVIKRIENDFIPYAKTLKEGVDNKGIMNLEDLLNKFNDSNINHILETDDNYENLKKIKDDLQSGGNRYFKKNIKVNIGLLKKYVGNKKFETLLKEYLQPKQNITPENSGGSDRGVILTEKDHDNGVKPIIYNEISGSPAGKDYINSAKTKLDELRNLYNGLNEMYEEVKKLNKLDDSTINLGDLEIKINDLKENSIDDYIKDWTGKYDIKIEEITNGIFTHYADKLITNIDTLTNNYKTINNQLRDYITSIKEKREALKKMDITKEPGMKELMELINNYNKETQDFEVIIDKIKEI